MGSYLSLKGLQRLSIPEGIPAEEGSPAGEGSPAVDTLAAAGSPAEDSRLHASHSCEASGIWAEATIEAHLDNPGNTFWIPVRLCDSQILIRSPHAL
jgi:hypothetical protein